ncbi:DNA (cytosine-5-)-methyltransferase [Winogradskyella sp. PC-19]|uniref:DNA (cytosine-5-)-methyltransferase n=1 Tax=unclassified Winogradskyella TaxID=2615021 RepID=UPI000B3C3D14|nr:MULTISPECIES: DNA (cytosine-5-)-methyltransferase [unclassified Winogradskyella]ARV10333.1 DNA (cytosine-5-)-methyltransferase [Winogradskyella sp. PC-19]RZN78578.1 MAG: DNA (cytosine-5-)-methyltransferase [Winogradskyella sp.]
MSKQKIRVAELFAGVGGFRLGLEAYNKLDTNLNVEVVWSNQWEPSTKRQHASEVYETRFGSKNHSNKDIASVPVSDISEHDLLVGGFPCQDYSVATTLKNSKGLQGKKGVLWWEIYRILNESKNKPKYLFLENVDRLLKSPSKQRGRDFAIMLKSLGDLGYSVEWRVINAADYGMPQRRRRVFILGYLKSTSVYKKMKVSDDEDWILKDGILAESFPIDFEKDLHRFELNDDVKTISDTFNIGGKLSLFKNSGICINNQVCTLKSKAQFEGGRIKLKDVLVSDNEVSEEFYISENELDKWNYLKGAKKEIRETKDGFKYNYAEGAMIFPDNLDNASRTIITGEGGKSASRFKHVIKTRKGYRRLTPVELERLNMFPDNHTELEDITNTKRAFFMGNALVVGVVERIGETLFNEIAKDKSV